MSVTQDRETLARTFERSADLYDEARPGYPDALFNDLARLSAIPLQLLPRALRSVREGR